MTEFNYKLVTSAEEQKEAFEVRRCVFVEEQGVPEHLELDGHDGEALHMVVKERNRVIGTARVLFLPSGLAKIERMAIRKPFRRRGIGKRVMFFLEEELIRRQIEQVFLHAQYPVVAFYRLCGFEETGSPFWEAGIKHLKMQKQI